MDIKTTTKTVYTLLTARPTTQISTIAHIIEPADWYNASRAETIRFFAGLGAIAGISALAVRTAWIASTDVYLIGEMYYKIFRDRKK